MEPTQRWLARWRLQVSRNSLLLFLGLAALMGPGAGRAAGEPQEESGYNPACGVSIRQEAGALEAEWQLGENERGRIRLDLELGAPLIRALSVREGTGPWSVVLERVTPRVWVTVGTRVAPPGRPPEMSPFNTFFDNPAERPHTTYAAEIVPLPAPRIASAGRRVRAVVGTVTAGPFRGELVLTWYSDARLFRIEAEVATAGDRTAYLYDAGLVGSPASFPRIAWLDERGKENEVSLDSGAGPGRLRVRPRMVIAETGGGAVAVFPPPHQYQFPRDWTDNLGFNWVGQPHATTGPARDELGLGICQHVRGGGPFVPWWNAPPGTRQHLSFYCLVSRGAAGDARREALRYTRGDRFEALPGHLTFTSHFHMAIAVAALAAGKAPAGEVPVPDWALAFRELGVNLVHLAEFHGDGHQFDPGATRLAELEAMFHECRRLSDERLLVIPGEEINTYLGLPAEGRHPGHWMSLFPRPVRFILKRDPGLPYVELDQSGTRIYRVGSREDMMRLLVDEKGLAWAAHPRIKASSWTPDIFKDQDFYRAETWLGAAWKAMPGDLSRERLGERALDLLDDMASWGIKAPAGVSAGGRQKYLPGEVDVFKIDRTHELYGHMNINYLRLEGVPRFEEGWQPVLDALRGGRFFVTTGEVLLRSFRVAGRESGETARLPPGGRCQLDAELEGTFPLQFAEVISGDGDRVFRERIDLRDSRPFDRRRLELTLDLGARRWVRLEVWDSAANGAFTQPVWLDAP